MQRLDGRIEARPPAIVHASPADIPEQPGGALTPDFVTFFDGKDVPFWRPDAAVILKAIGWKWFVLVPALVFIVGLPLSPFLLGRTGGAFANAWAQFAKLWVLAIGVVITLVLSAARKGVSMRTEDFCIHCGYELTGLDAYGTCPECGRPFVASMVSEFRKDPHFFQIRYKALKTHIPGAAILAGDGPTPDDGTR